MMAKKGGGHTNSTPPSRGVLAVDVAVDAAVLSYRHAPPCDAQTPVRSYAPTDDKLKAKPKPPRRRRYSPGDEIDIMRMHLAVIVARAVERRMPPARGPAPTSGRWPLATLADRHTDYAPDNVVVRPSRPDAAAVQFWEDVCGLVARIARDDALGAKLVVQRAARVGWSQLEVADPKRRRRMQLDEVRRATLLRMVRLDRSEKLRIVARVR